MASNNRISNLINSQVPFFVRNDHRTFVAFLEAYYEYLEQTSNTLADGKAIERRENLLNYMDIDKTIVDFEQNLYDKFLKDFPTNIVADKHVIMKHAKDIFRSKGTEKSVRFMLRAMFGSDVDDIEFYYPKDDILRASDGKWYIQKSLRIDGVKINNTSNNDLTGLDKFTTTRITGNLSSASAVVERIDRFYTAGVLQDELVLSSIAGSFVNGEEIFTQFIDTDGVLKPITANVQGGVIASLTINNPGSNYTTNDSVVVISTTGQNAVIRIAKVTTGNIAALSVTNGGAGYQTNNYLTITGGGGSGANAILDGVDLTQTYHPSSYNIVSSLISLEANVTIGNLTYSNLMIGTANTYNAYNAIAQTVSFFTYSNTGPANVITVIASGSGFIGVPDIEIPANTRIKNLGILGRIDINTGGTGYANGDIIQFINPAGSYGVGANANVVVDANGTIVRTNWIETPGLPIGGAGYNQEILPIANVVSGTGTNASLSVTATLGYGAAFSFANSTIGSIERLVIESGGVGYELNPVIDLTGSGDGTANVTATVFEGVITYPGRYLNDDGFLSSSNYLEDRDYYQIFSYVIRVKESISNYRDVLKNITHPAGFKMFGEYLHVDESDEISSSEASPDAGVYRTNRTTYTSSNNLVINYTAHGKVANDKVYLEFLTGNVVTSNVANVNGEYVVKSVINANSFIVYSGTKIMGAANITAYETSIQGLHIKDDGQRVYFIGSGQDRIREYNLIRPGDITSAVYSRTSPSIAGYDQTPTDLEFKPDGSKVYVTGDTNNTIYQYKLDENWNAASLNVVTNSVLSFNVNAYETVATAVRFNTSGNMMYIIGQTSDRLWQFSLSEAWNVATASLYTQSNTSISNKETSASDFLFTNNGNSVLIIGTSQDRIQLYNLQNAYNVNTIYFVANTANLNITAATGMKFSNNGSILYFTDNDSDSIIQLPLREAYNVFTAPVYTANTGNVNYTRTV